MKVVRVKSGPFAVIPLSIMTADLSPAAFRLWCALSSFSDSEGTSWPSRHALMARMVKRTHEKTVQHAIRELVSKGYLVVRHQTKDSGLTTSSVYRLGADMETVDEGSETAPLGERNGSPQGSETAPLYKEVLEPTKEPTKRTIPPPPQGGRREWSRAEWGTVEALVHLYNVEAPDNVPPVSTISEMRRKRALKWLKQYPERQWWVDVFASYRDSRFLSGRTKPNPGHESFRPDFDWLLANGKSGVENAVKVHDGAYDD